MISLKKKFFKTRKTCVAIVPAAGSSNRMKDSGNKIFLPINNIMVIARTLSAFERCSKIDEIIIPTREDMIDEIQNICKENSFKKVTAVIPGGNSRAESVLNGIIASGGRFDLIAIHDAARPFVSQKIIESTISAAEHYNAAAPAVPLKDTIKKASSSIIEETIPRETLYAIQTPQIFDSDLITAALTKAVKENLPITDDCSAVELIGMRVFMTQGDYFNIKITTPEDIIFAEAISKTIDSEEVTL